MTFKEFIEKSRLRPWDFIIILGLILCSFLPFIIFRFSHPQPISEQTTKQAILKVDNKVIKTFELKKEGPTYTYKYTDADGDYNLIEIKGDKIRIAEANCGDQVCVRRGWISKPGGTPIACLPHNLLITVEASDGSEDGSLIY